MPLLPRPLRAPPWQTLTVVQTRSKLMNCSVACTIPESNTSSDVFSDGFVDKKKTNKHWGCALGPKPWLYFRTLEPNSRATSPSCSDYENFPMVPSVETSYLARAGKHEFLNLVPDIEEMRPGLVLSRFNRECNLVELQISAAETWFCPVLMLVMLVEFKENIKWNSNGSLCAKYFCTMLLWIPRSEVFV